MSLMLRVYVSTAENCSGYRTCSQCLEQPGCGWCTDPSNTGRGQCMEGSYRGPIQTLLHAPSSSRPSLVPAPQALLNVSWCPHENKYNWSFIQCPGIDISAHISETPPHTHSDNFCHRIFCDRASSHTVPLPLFLQHASVMATVHASMRVCVRNVKISPLASTVRAAYPVTMVTPPMGVAVSVSD